MNLDSAFAEILQIIQISYRFYSLFAPSTSTPDPHSRFKLYRANANLGFAHHTQLSLDDPLLFRQ
jgi:hypothetical protein